MDENNLSEALQQELTPAAIRKQMNHVGKALLFNTFLQVYVPLIITFIFTLSLAQMLHLSRFSYFLNNNFMGLVTLLTIIALVVAESVPFIICSQRLKIKMADFFQRPTMSIKTILMFAIILLGVNAFASLIVQGVEILLNGTGFHLTTPDFSLGEGIVNQVLMIIMVVVVAPIGEEFMLRGVCLKALSKYGTSFAIIVTSFIFSLLHGNFIQGIPTFFMGLILGYVAIKSKSILPTILIHFINNAFSLCESWIANFLPYFPLIMLVLLLFAAIYLIMKYRSTFTLAEKIPNHPACWKCFFTSYSIIIFMILYLLIFALSVTPLSFLQI